MQAVQAMGGLLGAVQAMGGARPCGPCMPWEEQRGAHQGSTHSEIQNLTGVFGFSLMKILYIDIKQNTCKILNF